MKCPKCNYVSHDYLEACRKCGVDLVAFKQEIGLLVLQPGVLDLSLVLGGAGADDLFESVEEEVIMHAGEDDDFDISLDDYVDQPGVRRPFATTPRRGGRPADEDLGGLDHLTLELDAADLPADLTARLRASQVLPGTPPMPPPAAPPAASGREDEAFPEYMTLDMGRDTISSELPPDILKEAARLAPPPPPAPPTSPAPARSEPQETIQISRALGLGVGGLGLAAAAAAALSQLPRAAPEAPEESLPLKLNSGNIDVTPAAPVTALDEDGEASGAATVANISGPLPSLQLHDVSLVDEPEAVDPTIPTLELPDVAVPVPYLDESPSAADTASAMLNSFELNIDDTAFAVGATSEALGETAEGLEAGLDTELDLSLDVARLASPTLAEDTLLVAEAETSLPALETAALDAASITLADDDAQASLLSSALPPMEDAPAVEGALTSSDMFVLGDLEDDTALPGHLTLEFNASDLPAALPSQLLEEAVVEALPEPPPVPDVAPPSTGRRFTVSDALVLGDLEDMEDDADPGHLTLELDASEIPDIGSITLEDIQLEEPLGDSRSAALETPMENQVHDEEELLLDLDDFEFVDDDDEQK